MSPSCSRKDPVGPQNAAEPGRGVRKEESPAHRFRRAHSPRSVSLALVGCGVEVRERQSEESDQVAVRLGPPSGRHPREWPRASRMHIAPKLLTLSLS